MQVSAGEPLNPSMVKTLERCVHVTDSAESVCMSKGSALHQDVFLNAAWMNMYTLKGATMVGVHSRRTWGLMGQNESSLDGRHIVVHQTAT